MMNSTGHTSADQPLLDAYPELQCLLDLRHSGWSFQSVMVAGEVELVAGARSWPNGWSDAIAIRDLGDTRAFRCDPDGNEVWQCEGGLNDVIDALTELPAPGQPRTRNLTKAEASKLWTPGDELP